jgi:hypothetical protein
MIMRKVLILAVLIFLAVLPGAGCKKSAVEAGKTPESIFNMATEAMVENNDALAIELYYKLENSYPDFKKYRPDVLFRLGNLLYKTERFDESEKIFSVFASDYKDDARLKAVYEKLLCIYMQEFHDETRAQTIRDLYAKKFKSSPVLKEIDKTMNVLNSDEAEGSALLAMDAGMICIIKYEKISDLDKENFPVINSVTKSAKSPDGRFLAEIRKKSGNNYIYYGPTDSKLKMIDGSKLGNAPQWSWNSRYILFTSMDIRTGERKIKIFDTAKKNLREVFRAKGLEPLLCASPDSSKVAFSYNGKLWVMNMNGNSVTLLSKSLNAAGLNEISWSREGSSIMFSKRKNGAEYYKCQLGRREIENVK